MQVCKPCHYALVEAVEPFKMHPMSISYIYEVFEHLLRMWMGIWLLIHTITRTYATPDLWELAEILPNANVQTMPLRFDWGCRTFQTASHVHSIHVRGVWAPSQVVDGHMASHSHHYPHRHFPIFVKVCWNPAYASVQTMPLRFGWGCRTFQTASHVHGIPIWGVCAPTQVVDGHMALHSHHYHHRCFPRFVRVGWSPTCSSVQTMPLHFALDCRTFQIASYVHGIPIGEVWAPSQVVN